MQDVTAWENGFKPKALNCATWRNSGLLIARLDFVGLGRSKTANPSRGEGTLDGTMRQGLDGSASSKALGPQMQLELAEIR